MYAPSHASCETPGDCSVRRFVFAKLGTKQSPFLFLMSLELALAAGAFGFSLLLALWVWRRPSVLSENYQAKLDELKTESQQQIEALRRELRTERDEGRRNREDLTKVLKLNIQLYDEIQRLNEINTWMRHQLRTREVGIPQLPKHLQDSRLDTPTLSISIESLQSGGVTVRDQARLDVHRDVVGGDQNESQS